MDSAIQETSTARTDVRMSISPRDSGGLPYGPTNQKWKSLDTTRVSLLPSSLQLLEGFRANDRTPPQYFW